jgi:hypothetical protein
MRILGFLFKIPLVIAAALVGNQIGYYVREEYLGKPGHHLRLYERGENDEITVAVNPIMTNFLPAALFGLLGKPGWLTALVAGAVIAALVADDYESQFWAILGMADEEEVSAG